MTTQKIAIIGAGISGLLTACISAQKGWSVTVYEKQSFPPINASSIAGGMLAPFSEIETLPMSFIKTGLKGIDLWKEVLGEKLDLSFESRGSLLLAHPEDHHMLERFARHLLAMTERWERVDAKRIQELEPRLGNRFREGLYIPEEAHILPFQALESLAEKFRELGGRIIQKEADPEKLANDYDWVIDCRGYVEDMDQDLRGIKGEIILLQNPDITLNRPVRMMHPRYPLYIIPRPDHIFAVGATAIESGDDDSHVMLRSAMELMSAAYSLHPAFGESRVLDMSAGVRAAYPDNLPRIKIDKNKNYIRSNGLFRHGYLLSPVMAECIADYIDTEEENEDFVLFSGKFNHCALSSPRRFEETLKQRGSSNENRFAVHMTPGSRNNAR